MVGVDIPATTRGFNIIAPRNGVSRRHCSICLREGRVWLDDHSTFGTFLNGDRIHGGSVLHVGDRIGLGTPEGILALITVVD
jgi:pSer/pThr/pTyr-binding forkhead associated (FHA) protein